MDVVYRADLETTCLVIDVRLTSQENNGDFPRGGVRLETGTTFVAADSGHHDVEKDEV